MIVPLIVFQQVGDARDGCLLVLVQHLCIDLCRGDVAMSEEFARGVDIRTEVEHHHGKRVPCAVERDFLIDTSCIDPALQIGVRV